MKKYPFIQTLIRKQFSSLYTEWLFVIIFFIETNLIPCLQPRLRKSGYLCAFIFIHLFDLILLYLYFGGIGSLMALIMLLRKKNPPHVCCAVGFIFIAELTVSDNSSILPLHHQDGYTHHLQYGLRRYQKYRFQVQS